MSRIDDLIAKYCQDGVEYRKIENIVKIISSPKKLNKKEYQEVGKYPIVDQGQKYIIAYTSDKSAILPESEYVIFGDHTREIKFVTSSFAQGADGLKIIQSKDRTIISKFLYYSFCNLHIPNRGYNRHWSIVKSIKIPVPPLPVQKEIVTILDKFTELEAELEAELEERQKQYIYYRGRLLTFSEQEVEWKQLRDVAEYSKTRISFNQLDEKNYVGVDNLLQNRAGKAESNYVPKSGNLTEYRKDDILIGNIRPYLKKIWHADCIGGTNGDVLVIHIIDKTVNSRYLYQVLADDKFFEYNMQHAKGAKMPRGNKRKIMEYSIPIPKNEAEQVRIVSILDKFYTLTNSISEGLPREIALHQKQYKYYRDVLLNFPKPEEEAV